MTPAKLSAFLALAQLRLSEFTEEEAAKKHTFHRDGKAVLLELARLAELTRVSIRSNKAGPAIGGEVTLESAEVFVQLAAGCEHGVLYRHAAHAPNRWLPWAALSNLRAFAATLRFRKTCACGRSFDAAEWEELPDATPFVIEGDPPEHCEQRRCLCGSHIAIVVTS